MAIELYYTTSKLEEANETGECPHCEKVSSITSLLDVNYSMAEETGEFIQCNHCKAVTFIHDDMTGIVEITEPVKVSWETFHSHILDAPSKKATQPKKTAEEAQAEAKKEDVSKLKDKIDSDLPIQ